MNILVTGGAGYIGSLTVKRLINKGINVTVYDNLVYGHEKSVSCRLIKGDLTDKEHLFTSLNKVSFDAVIHFAAYAYPGESMKEPYKYFYNNLSGGLNVLDLMKEKNIPHIIFSSSCSIYGSPQSLPVREEDSKNPESVYGESKLMFEKILFWYERTTNIKHINLRYFNAAGAALDNTLGEDHNPETHIIPLAINAAIHGTPFSLFGSDYPTRDGTCVRDYIHIEDLADAHLRALDFLQTSQKSDSFNLGTGKGFTIKEVVSMIEKIGNRKMNIELKERRAGDPPSVFADNSKAKKVLGFQPKFSDLETIIQTAWKWHAK
jgi:UDP-glucose 4-epimerase